MDTLQPLVVVSTVAIEQKTTNSPKVNLRSRVYHWTI